MPDKTVEELQVLYSIIQGVNNKTIQALRIRGNILININRTALTLQANPGDQAARRSLVLNLDRERKFMSIIKHGVENGESILKSTLKILRNIDKKNPDTINNEMLQMLQLLLDVMGFADSKLNAIKKRIELGEALEQRDYNGRYLSSFMETLKEESRIDREINLRLQGNSQFMANRLERLQSRLGIRFNWKTAPGALTGPIVGGGTGAIVIATGGAVSIPILIAGIIFLSYIGMRSWTSQSEEKSLRAGAGFG